MVAYPSPYLPYTFGFDGVTVVPPATAIYASTAFDTDAPLLSTSTAATLSLAGATATTSPLALSSAAVTAVDGAASTAATAPSVASSGTVPPPPLPQLHHRQSMRDASETVTPSILHLSPVSTTVVSAFAGAEAAAGVDAPRGGGSFRLAGSFGAAVASAGSVVGTGASVSTVAAGMLLPPIFTAEIQRLVAAYLKRPRAGLMQPAVAADPDVAQMYVVMVWW